MTAVPRRVRLAAGLLLVGLTALGAQAAEPATGAPAGSNAALLQLFKILKERGSISAQEYELLNGLATTAPAPAPAVAAGTAAPAGSGAPPAAPAATGTAPLARSTTGEGPDVKGLKSLLGGKAAPTVGKALGSKWYEKYDVGGYTQLRFTSMLDDQGGLMNVPNDRSVSETESLMIRRGRFKFSGDVSDHLYLYSQVDLAGSVGGAGDLGLQARDLYADIAFDVEKEYRIRAGLSKVPYGWVNMQSSQNRAPMERPDALNSAVEGERDYGLYFMYATAESRKRFKDLVKSGLKGSGDYGMLTLGVFNGQGLNRSDLNGEPHLLARLTYPFKFDNGQYFEVGIQGYSGRFVPTAAADAARGLPVAPGFSSKGVLDERAAVSAVWYPQPFGFEAEWTIGRGPQLSGNGLRIQDESLQGGYLMANYRLQTGAGEFFPFLRWNYFDGGRKFGRNAPSAHVNEVDFGLEWSPWPELEASVMYTHTFERTDTRTFPYNTTQGADRIGFQLQWNY